MPLASVYDGAQASPMPRVPTAYETSGRLPMPIQGVVGTITVPDTAILEPVADVERYRTCHDFVPGTGVRLAGSSVNVLARERMTSPLLPVSVDGGV
ncbi:MAG: hypothetical protein R2701_03860 [Acidimicrobiales bacterium]